MGGVTGNSENFAELLEESQIPQARLERGQKVEGTITDISGDAVFVDVGMKQEGIMEKGELPGEAQVGDTVTAYVTELSPQGVKLSRSMSGAGIAPFEDALASGAPMLGTVKEACKGGYRVDISGKIAFCPGSQMERPASGNPEDVIGQEMLFLVSRVENNGRNIVVSRRALLDRERGENLAAFMDTHKAGETIEGTVTRLAPFGAFLEVAPGVEGMVHVSELSWSRVDRPDEVVSVGDRLRVKIVELGQDEKGKARIALSVKQGEGDPWNEVEEKFHVGDVVSGKVRRLAPFGAFVEIAPGIEGLVHLSEMSWTRRVNKAGDVVETGETVPVKIREINAAGRRISLSMKDAEGDPWLEAEELFAPGTVVEGMVESRTPHGIFVSLKEGITGLLPASALKNAPAPLKNAAPGDKLELIIQNLDTNARRISLLPKEKEEAARERDDSWRKHVEKKPAESMGTLAEALQKAMQKRNSK